MKLFLLLICVTFNQSFAADEKPVEKPTNKTAEVSTPEQNLASAGNREKVKYQITLNVIGSEYSTSAISVGLGYHLDPKDMFLLRYSNYNGNNDSTKKLRAVTFGYRRFEGNSFNIMPSLYYRESTKSYFSTASGWFQMSDYVLKDVGIGFRIGNEWQWEHFMMGVDWIGINRSVKKLSETQATGIIGDIDRTYTITFLSLYFGYSF